MAIEHYDVAIVGAGPAGSTCANSLLLHGVQSVALIDKELFPRDKSCGDGIGPGAVQTLRSIGLGECLKNHVKIKFLSVSSPSGIRAKGPLPKISGAIPVGYTIPRHLFDNYICQAALKRGAGNYTGYDYVEGRYDSDKSQWHLFLRKEDEPIEITARVLIGADGARSRVRRQLGVPFNSDRHTGTAVRIYAESTKSHFDSLQIDFVSTLLPAYGWLFPIDHNRANIGVGIDLANYKRRDTHLRTLLQKYQTNLSTNLVYDEKSYLAFILPYGSQLPKLAHPASNAALIGDAGSMINPLTGEGIYYGMFAGELIGRLLADSLPKNSAVAISSAIIDFERKFRFRFKRHYSLNWDMKEKIQDPRWCDMVVNACRKDSKVLSDVIDLMMGDKTDIDLSTMFRIFARNFLPFLP
jgi:geranylgeranyl reductase family protein